jgi:hypothetical protein
MNELGSHLKSAWEGSGSGPLPLIQFNTLIEAALRANQESKKFQTLTLLILGSTFVMMAYFLLFYFGFREALSQVGVGLMLGFFLLRIVLEAYSLWKGKEKVIASSAVESLEKEKTYLRLRLQIHGFFTYLTLGFYTLGFIFLLPEFSRYIPPVWMVALVASYFIPGIILTILIRKNVQKEIRELRAVVEIREKLMQ